MRDCPRFHSCAVSWGGHYRPLHRPTSGRLSHHSQRRVSTGELQHQGRRCCCCCGWDLEQRGPAVGKRIWPAARVFGVRLWAQNGWPDWKWPLQWHTHPPHPPPTFAGLNINHVMLLYAAVYSCALVCNNNSPELSFAPTAPVKI